MHYWQLFLAFSSDKNNPTQIRYVYNSKSNRVVYDAEEQLNYFSMAVYYDGTPEYSFPVYVDGRIDWVKSSVLYTYSFEGIPGRFTSHLMKITDLEYNGKQLYSDPTDDFYDYYDDKTFPQKIFVRKTTDGVTVSFAR